MTSCSIYRRKVFRLDKKAIIFDMDGLMFDTENLTYQAQDRLAKKLGLPFSKEYYMQTVGVSDKDCLKKYIKDFGDNETTYQFAEGYRTEVYNIVDEEGVPQKKGLTSLLHYLTKKNIVCVLASSNLRYDVEYFLKNTGLSDYFKDIISGDEVNNAKPDPEIFLKAVQLTELDKDACLILEDSLAGVRSAYAAGVDVIMVPDLIPPNEETKEKSLITLDDLEQVKEWLKKNNK